MAVRSAGPWNAAPDSPGGTLVAPLLGSRDPSGLDLTTSHVGSPRTTTGLVLPRSWARLPGAPWTTLTSQVIALWRVFPQGMPSNVRPPV